MPSKVARPRDQDRGSREDPIDRRKMKRGEWQRMRRAEGDQKVSKGSIAHWVQSTLFVPKIELDGSRRPKPNRTTVRRASTDLADAISKHRTGKKFQSFSAPIDFFRLF
jgi:hypothetical protein